MAKALSLTPRGPFSLAASTRFLEGFTPAAYAPAEAGHLHLAFPVETDEWRSAAACVTQPSDSLLRVQLAGAADPDAVREQLKRILSLHVDGREWPAVGQRDPVMGRLQKSYGGLRPVAFNSPYEAAAWAIIGQRIRIIQAARLKERMAQEAGDHLSLHGFPIAAFPSPRALATGKGLAGLPSVKQERLAGLARAALDGRLDAQRLEGLGRDAAVAALQELPGIGPFSAELTVLRGVNLPDGIPNSEPRLARAIALAYDLRTEPSGDEIEKLAEKWRPYRTWAAVLLRTNLESETTEIAGRRAQAPPVPN